jgi:hypothetical protein
MSSRLAPGSWLHPSPQPAIDSWRVSAPSDSLASALDPEDGKPMTRESFALPTSDRVGRLQVPLVRRALSLRRWRWN